jgi:heat shock protein HslJ
VPAGSRWLLVELPGADTASGIRQTLEFPEPGRIAGNGGCNRFGGEARLDGDRLAVSQLVTTRRACAPEAMALESRYLAALSAAEKVVAEGKALSLHSGASAAPLRFVRIE